MHIVGNVACDSWPPEMTLNQFNCLPLAWMFSTWEVMALVDNVMMKLFVPWNINLTLICHNPPSSAHSSPLKSPPPCPNSLNAFTTCSSLSQQFLTLSINSTSSPSIIIMEQILTDFGSSISGVIITWLMLSDLPWSCSL
jgi:hypothetical protein